jgi:hypothetical protein
MEYREGRGVVLFCQVDVTGRTEPEPAAERLVANLLQYISSWMPSPRRRAVYVGGPAGRSYLESAGIPVTNYDGAQLLADQVLVAGHDAGPELAGRGPAIADWLKAGGNLLAIGLEQSDAEAFLPFPVVLKKAEHISACFEPFALNSLLKGVGSADVHNRDPRDLPLIQAGASRVGDGVLGTVENANVIFCQLEPWQFDPTKQANLKRTYRRASFLVSRLLANMGVAAPTPLLERFGSPLKFGQTERRWLTGFYMDTPEEWDDPYRFFRW